MSEPLHGLVLDSLVPDIELEAEAAARLGAQLVRWDGTDEQLADAAFVLHVRTRVDEALLARLPRLRAIGRFGTGLDSVDLDAAARHGIPVIGVPDYCSREVAQHAVALALAVARGVASLGPLAPATAWDGLLRAPALGAEGPVGIVGFGAIGAAAAGMFAGLGFDVLVHTRRGDVDLAAHGYEAATLDELLTRCEIVSLHSALDAGTRHMIGREQLALMGPAAILVNTSRAGLVDPAALVHALDEGRLRGAGLDAFEGEDGATLWELLGDRRLNVVTTPHIAWCSPRSLARLRTEAVTRTVEAARAAAAAT